MKNPTEMKRLFVLIGEMKGDYEDFYQRYRDVLAVAPSEDLLLQFKEKYYAMDGDYVEYAIEDVPFVEG